MIISHRGRGTGLPENSIAAFEAALAAGADGIECDLRMTADGRVLVHHGGTYGHKRMGVRWHTFRDIEQVARDEGSELLTVDGLVDYVSQVKAPFFMEVKDPAPALMIRVIRLIHRRGLWDRVSLVGFPGLINSAAQARERYPKLQTWRILLLPAIARARLSFGGAGVFLGWQDSVPGTERLFKATFPEQSLGRLVERCAERDMRVVAGVINRADGFELFRRAGIHDIVTDDVPAAVLFFRPALGAPIRAGARAGR